MAIEEPSRRTFLTGAGAAALAGLAAACSADELGEAGDEAVADRRDAAGQTGAGPAGTGEADAAASPDMAGTAARATTDGAANAVAFAGPHQLGVLQPPATAGLVAAFDVIVGDRASLAETLQTLSAEIARIMAGRPAGQREEYRPPNDSGAVDRAEATLGTAITVGIGASLFDDRFGLADRRPSELIEMPLFFNDRLVRPGLSHGDLALTISGPSRQAVVYALQQAVRVTDRKLRLKWLQEGHNELLPPDPDEPDRIAPTRNLMGFRDGTSNLDTTDPAEMDAHVWVGADDGEPEWAVGGTYQAVRIIRMMIEFWATAALVRQEQIFGRHRDSGAPLGQDAEGDEPGFAVDRADDSVPPRSHIRLANPRTSDTGRILRRGFSYVNGVDPADATLDQGLLFLAYQRSLGRGFLAAQSRLNGEPLEDYIKPVGGGAFFVLPGLGVAGEGWLGESLLS